MPYTTVEVEIDLDDFTTEDLIEELNHRGAYRQELPEEIIEKLNTYGVTCSLTPLKCWIGQEVYSVSENGMMHISARKVDSSD